MFTLICFHKYCSQLSHCQKSHFISILKTLTLHFLYEFFFILELPHSLQCFFYSKFITKSTPKHCNRTIKLFSIWSNISYTYMFHYFSLNILLLDLPCPLLPSDLFLYKAHRALEKLIFFFPLS